MKNEYATILLDHIKNSALTSGEKEEIGQIIKKIDKDLKLLNFKFRRTQKEKNALTSLLAQISKDLTEKMEESEEKSRILEQKNHELEQARKIADQANQTKSQFLANMSHEIRTPINGVLGMVQLLELTSVSKEQQEYIESLKVGGESLLSIINEILDFSKIEAGKLELETHPFSIKANIQSTLDLLMPLASAKGLDLSYQFDHDVPHILVGDSSKITQVLTNLIGNGIKFTENGSVSITVRKYPPSFGKNMFHFVVRDTGIGIAKDHISRLFLPFTQVDASTTRKYGGSGLGLAISGRLVNLMGGKIWAESEEGVGSAFHFTVILKEPSALESKYETLTRAGRSRISLNAEMAKKLPLNILLAEDDEVSQILAESSFRKMGYEIKIAEDGAKALQMATQEDFDMIFMDLHMPKMEGIEVSQRIRAYYGDNSYPIVVAMTANVFQEVEDTCLRGGMNDFISKPYKLTVLQSVIEKWGRKLLFPKIQGTLPGVEAEISEKTKNRVG